jgi:hypothetical protein
MTSLPRWYHVEYCYVGIGRPIDFVQHSILTRTIRTNEKRGCHILFIDNLYKMGLSYLIHRQPLQDREIPPRRGGDLLGSIECLEFL